MSRLTREGLRYAGRLPGAIRRPERRFATR
jgi:hypothetical protein